MLSLLTCDIHPIFAAELEGAAELAEGAAGAGFSHDAPARRRRDPWRAAGACRRAAEPQPPGRRRRSGDAQQPAPGAHLSAVFVAILMAQCRGQR